MKKQLTLCLIHNHPQVLLGLKKRGFGEGKYNGFGGKLEAGESIEEAAKRELLEESGLVAHNIEKCGIVEFEFKNKEEIMEVHIFRAENFSGDPIESDEMRPEWFYIDELPFDKMWPDDKYWFPLFLKKRKFKGKFFFDEDEHTILEHQLDLVSEIE